VAFITVAAGLSGYIHCHAGGKRSVRRWEMIMNNSIRELSLEEMGTVSGGMKWDRNHVSKDVIDARGGQFTALGLIFTVDLEGNITSFTPR
jgi:hypothetical protein